MPKFKRIAREGKIQRLVETQEPLPLGQSTCRACIEQITTFLYPTNWVEHCISPFLQKGCAKNVLKTLIMLKVQSPENCQRSCLFLLRQIQELNFLLPKWILKNKIIIQHPSAQPEKVVRFKFSTYHQIPLFCFLFPHVCPLLLSDNILDTNLSV